MYKYLILVFLLALVGCNSTKKPDRISYEDGPVFRGHMPSQQQANPFGS